MIKLENIFTHTPKSLDEEFVKTISGRDIRIELVTSPESKSPSKIYDQVEDEFVYLAEGHAQLELQRKNFDEVIKMNKGDYLEIPAHLKHRVLETGKDTKWVCVFYKK